MELGVLWSVKSCALTVIIFMAHCYLNRDRLLCSYFFGVAFGHQVAVCMCSLLLLTISVASGHASRFRESTRNLSSGRQRDSSKEGREIVSMRRTATRHQHKGNGQTCSVSRKMLSLLICFAGLNATQTQPVPSFRHDWGLHNAFISASSSIITGLQLPPQRSNCRRRILEYQKQ
ncbi:unnamed protein product [Musa banksii]